MMEDRLRAALIRARSDIIAGQNCSGGWWNDSRVYDAVARIDEVLGFVLTPESIRVFDNAKTRCDDDTTT
jgi:hypothetical protein